MNIKSGERAKVFKPEKSEKRNNTITANLSTKEGKRENGDPIYSTWYANFVGEAYKKAEALEDGAWIELLSAKVENNYNKEQERVYITVTVFDFDVMESD